MVKFLISLTLHNFETKPDIYTFYKSIFIIIKNIYNSSIKKNHRLKDFYEPFIKIKKHIFKSKTIRSTYETNPKIINVIEFKMSREREELALEQFYKDYNMVHKSYKELKTLYYSTKIIQFVTIVKGLISKNIVWTYYKNKMHLQMKYKPNITVSDAVVLSLKRKHST